MTKHQVSRRTAGMFALTGLSLGAASQGVPVKAATTTQHTLPTKPEDILNTLVRIYGTSGPNRVTWKTRITVYAVQPTGVTPLVGLRGSESAWWTKKDDQTYVRYSSTLSFFEDLESRQFIDEFKNPLTGKINKVGVSFIRHKEGEFYTTLGEYYGSMKKAFPDSYPQEPLHPNWDLDGDVIRLRGTSNFPPILKQPTKETATQMCRASEVFDPTIETPESTVSGWNIRPWEPWLEMGDAAGHVIWHFDGVKLTDVEMLDADYLERARAYTPLFDKTPMNDEGPSFFERVIQNRGVKPT